MTGELLTYVGLLSGILVAVWLLAVRSGPDWLRPGHGPLWYFAAGTVFAIGCAVAALQKHALVRSEAILGFPRTFNALLLALILLIALFPLMGLVLRALYKPGPRDPPCPAVFIWFGIAPDGSPLMGLRAMLRSLAVVGLLVATLLILGMNLAPVIGKGPPQYTLWAFGYATLLGILFGSTHPVRPLADPRRPRNVDTPPDKSPFSKRIDPIHRWLGAPNVVETLDAIGRDRKGAKKPDCRFGLELYPFQSRVLDDWQAVPALALAGPIGSGRTTAALVRAIDLALTTGASCTVIAARREGVPAILRQLRALTENIAAGAAVAVDDGLPPRPADIWVASLDDLEQFLDETADPAAHPLIERLKLVVLDDVEELYGPAVARARFVLYRLAALKGAQPPQLLILGNLGVGVLQHIADRIATAQVMVTATAGEHDAQGAPSRPVRRFVVDLTKIQHKQTSTAGLLGVRDGYARVLTEVDGPHERLFGDLLGQPWAPWPPSQQAQPEGSAEVLLARIGPRSAWQVLGHRRYYVEGLEPAHEYLLFADDPMSQLVLRQFRAHKRWWPTWYDTTRFPRVLSAVPAGQATPDGLQAQARSQMRAALDKGFVDTARLEQVFSREIVGKVLATLEGSRIFTSFEGWRPNPNDAKKPNIVRLCRAQGAVEADRDRRGEIAELLAPSTGSRWKVPRQLLDFLYFEGARVTFGGKRYVVALDTAAGLRAPLRLLEEEPGYRTATPVRTIRFAHHGAAKPDIRRPRFGGRDSLETVRCSVQLHLVHRGVHNFGYDRDQSSGLERGDADTLQRRFEKMLESPYEIAGFATRAWLLRLTGADDGVLHTLTHVMRDALDWIFLGASDFIGVSYELDFDGKPGIVFYDRHPDGLGCLDDIDDERDLYAILSAAREILASCDCQTSCAKCCRSVTCTQQPHNQNLDRHKALRLLQGLLGGSPA
ncbi:MAG: DUF1998 domain-containing protein [Myxococcales bacterium]|nr:DUF1998 domain-containing protein [Myxococcales bacterium]